MSLYFKGEEQSLQDILRSREIRVQYQEYLLDKYKNTVVSYKLNIPGPIKYNSLIKQIFDEGLTVFKLKLDEYLFQNLEEKTMYKNSGPEYFGTFNIEPEKIKGLTALIEETHPLGRLFDFDVIASNGLQLSREHIGIEPRKCLLCGKNAFECGRSRSHGVEALIAKIETMALDYFNAHNNDK
jgi:holo-ACP synthase